MSTISFRAHSLLYGESFLLACSSAFAPYFFWPDTAAAKTKHFLCMTPWRRKLLARLVHIWHRNSKTQFIVLGYLVSSQIAYGLLLITFGIIVQRDFHIFLNRLDESELTYKALYYAPVLYRMGLFLMIIIALCTRKEYREWKTLDHFEIFSVNRSSQVRTMVGCMSTLVPELICCWAEMIILVAFLRSDRYGFLQFTKASTAINCCFIFLALSINTTSSIIRYRPYLSLMYSTLCVRNHLFYLRGQLHLAHSKQIGSSASRNLRVDQLNGGPMKVDAESERATDIEHFLVALKRYKEEELLSRSGNDTTSYKAVADGGIVGSLYVSDRATNLAGRKQPVLYAYGSYVHQIEPDDLERPNEGPLSQIRTLFDLERHLTEVHLFVASLDRCSPGGVFAVNLFNAIAFFYANLFIRSVPKEQLNYIMAVLFFVARILPVSALLVAGQLLEIECRKLTVLIEIIHFEGNTQSMLYKQMRDSQNSLMRVFRLLARIKFSGDGLMSINLTSLVRIIVYVVSGIFIVIQYDSLLVIEDPEGHRKENSTLSTFNMSQYKPEIRFN